MSTTDKLNGFGPLAGVKVVELCEWVAAPAAVRCLSEMGATVIKTEPLHGDAQRTQGPGFGCEKNDFEDPTFDLNNTNKDLVAINLKNEEGMKFMKKLLADADVFVVNLRDKALKKLGLDYETIHEEFPTLIWAQMRGYGEFGEEKDSPGYDAVCWAARGGVANVFREAGESPAIAPQAFGDNNAACMLAGGICAALFNRTRTGVGEKVVTNLYAAAIFAGDIGICAQQFGADYPKSRTNVPNPFNNTYRTADDKWIYICMPQYDKYYEMMMDIFGYPEQKDNPDTRDLPHLKASGKNVEVIKWLEESFAKKDFDYWMDVFKENQVPAQKLFRYTDILKDEEAYVNDSLRYVEYDEWGKHALPMTPLRFGSAGDPPVILAKPVGYHTKEIMKRYGYTDEEIASIEDQGGVGVYHGEPIPDTIFKSQRQIAGEAPCTWED